MVGWNLLICGWWWPSLGDGLAAITQEWSPSSTYQKLLTLWWVPLTSLDQLPLALYWYLHTFKWKEGHKTLSWRVPTFGKYFQLGPLHPSSPSPQDNLDIVEPKIFWKFTTQPPQMKSRLFYFDHDRPLWKAYLYWKRQNYILWTGERAEKWTVRGRETKMCNWHSEKYSYNIWFPQRVGIFNVTLHFS